MARTRQRTVARRAIADRPRSVEATRDISFARLAAGTAVTTIVAVLYWRTSARDIVFGDTPELVGAAASLGVAHPPGYPIWTLLAHFYTLFPVGPIPFRVSLLSVTCGAATAALTYLIALRLTRSAWAASASALLLATAPVVWTWSSVPEVFPLNDVLVAALLLLLIEWHLTRRPRWFIAAAFVGGLGLANHQTIALLGPAVLLLMWEHRREFAGGALFMRATGAFLLGLVPYAYLPIAAAAHPAFNWGEISSLSGLIAHVLRVDYGSGQLVSEVRFQGGSATDRILALAESFNVAEAILATLGALALYRRDRVLLWFFGLGFVIVGPAFAAYSNISLSSQLTRSVLERFFLASHVVLAPLAALGIALIAEVAGGRRGMLRGRTASLAAAVAAVAVAAGLAWTQFDAIDRSQDHWARSFAEDILSTARHDAILFAGGDAVVMPIEYLHRIEGARRDLVFVDIPLLRGDWYVRQLQRTAPDLVLRYPRFDGLPGTMRSFIEPNDPTRFEVIGGLLDDTMSTTHVLVPHGLLSRFVPKSAPQDLDGVAADNTAVLATYHIPVLAAVAPVPWDRIILGDYASPPYAVAQLYEQQKANAKAREWYERALAIDPDFSEARAAITRLPP